jgi:hypothetical protein
MVKPRKKSSNGKPRGEFSYKDWYEKNKEGLADKRKKKYHSDKKYRAKVKAWNKIYAARQRTEQKDKPKSKVRVPKHRRPIVLKVIVYGESAEVKLVYVGAFARAIGRSVQTVHEWEKRELLPRTPYLLIGDTKRERLYTADMVLVVKGVLAKRGLKISTSDPTFRQEIVDGWRVAGTEVTE